MKKEILISFIVFTLIVGFGGGYFLGTHRGGVAQKPSICVNQAVGEIKDKLLKSKAITDYAGTLSGKVLSVKDQEMQFSAPLVNPFQDESFKTRTAIVTSKTKISILTWRSSAEMEKITKDLALKIAEAGVNLTTAEAKFKECLGESDSNGCTDLAKIEQMARTKVIELQSNSNSYVRTDGSIADIKPGWNVSVTAGVVDDKDVDRQSFGKSINIANELRFEAATIELSQDPVKDEKESVVIEKK